MKRYLALALVLSWILSLMGCASFGSKTAYCRVLAVNQAGLLVDMYDPAENAKIQENVYIPYPDADQSFKWFDTVVIQYHDSDLVKEEGTVPGYENQDVVYTYRYTLSAVQSARLADPSKNEPTFG